ncbi:hypothetical protein FD754_021926, partial [Muntiacus muntjak]
PQGKKVGVGTQKTKSKYFDFLKLVITFLPRSQSVSSVTQSCPTLCDPMNRSTPGLPVHHQLLEFTQTHAHRVGDAIQPSHPLSSPSPDPNLICCVTRGTQTGALTRAEGNHETNSSFNTSNNPSWLNQKQKELYFTASKLQIPGKRRRGRQRMRWLDGITDSMDMSLVNSGSWLYRPFYLQLTNMPFINYSIQKPSSPFDVEKPSSTQKQTQVKLRIQTDGDKCGGIPVQFQLKEKKKKGYCECCLQKYEDLDIHLLSEQHRNFAQSNHYQVVDDIVSKLVFDFVEYERDTPKKKRIKYSVGSLSPIFATVVKRSGTKEELKLLHNFQKDFRGNVHMIEQGFLYKEPLQEPEQKSVSTSEHTLHHSGEPRELDDKTSHKCSMLNPAENDIKQNFTPLPPCKNKQECILDVSEHKLILNESDLEVKVGNCPCRPQTSIQVSNFNTDDSASQRKQKSDTMLFPAKDLKEKDLYSVYHCDSDVLAINSSQEHLTIWAEIPSQSPPEEPNTCDIKSMDSLPSGKICRKVKIPLRRNKKENLEPNVGLDKKRTEFLTTQEENRICSSPVQSLLDLFQTSEEKSEFLGFTSYTDNNNICDVLDIWEEENSNLLTMFFSSPSTSTFTGF